MSGPAFEADAATLGHEVKGERWMDAAAPTATITQPYTEERLATPSIGPAPAPQAHAVDLGLGTFFRSGVASGGVIGLSPFVTDELGREVLVRIAASVGQPAQGGLHMTWVAGRLDTCSEMLGNYAAGSGLRLDLCGGADVGATFIGANEASAAQSLPFIDVGPSLDLRAETGPHAAVLLRAALGLSVARDTFVDQTGAVYEPPLVNLDLEIALSWSLQGEPSAPLVATAAHAR
jgi:hypothetical protein